MRSPRAALDARGGKILAESALSLGVLFLVGLICHVSIIPARLYWTDAFILAPLAFCLFISVWGRADVDFFTRMAYGMFQGIVLIAVYENHWGRQLRLGDPSEVFIEWTILVAVYAFVFGAVSQVVSMSMPVPHTVPLQCTVCGYSLRGLREPRCPECGSPFDPGLLRQVTSERGGTDISEPQHSDCGEEA